MTISSVWRQAGRVSLLALVPALGGALIAGPALASSHHTTLHDDHGLVTAVAGNDGFIKVKTTDHGVLTLDAPSKSLRDAVDAASVTDYVVVSYESGHKGKLVLKTLRDTSVAESGKVTAIASNHKLIQVKTDAHGTLRLHVLKLGLVDGVKVGEDVDVDYYKDAQGLYVLVNIGRKAPIGASGPGGGSAGSGSSGSSGGSFGSGSAGSGWSDSSAGDGDGDDS